MALEAGPGQFLSVYCRDGSRLLPRPVSICEIDKNLGRIRIVYRTVGSGTREMALWKEGDLVEILGPLGNGFPDVSEDRTAFLIGGGIGIPPMLELARSLKCRKKVILGYRDELFLNEEFEPYGDVFIATEDGSRGTRGNVLDAVREHGLKGDVIMACGPAPMLKARRNRAWNAIFPWRSGWPAEWAPAWRVSAGQKKWILIPTSITGGSVKTDLSSVQRRWSCR